MNGVREMAMLPIDETPAEQSSALTLFERLATDPNASVEKIERLMALWERVEARKAEQSSNSAMTDAQKAIRPIAADASNPQTRSRYASYAALDRALRPIYTEHGFGLSFDTGEATEDEVRVLCYVTHASGHSRTYKLDMPADGKGAKGGDVMTKTHATGSALSYGMRYLLKMIFNVAVGDEFDDDGNAAGKKAPEAKAPEGFDAWLADLEAVAIEGTDALHKTWQASSAALRAYLTKHHAATWESIKRVAAMKGAAK